MDTMTLTGIVLRDPIIRGSGAMRMATFQILVRALQENGTWRNTEPQNVANVLAAGEEQVTYIETYVRDGGYVTVTGTGESKAIQTAGKKDTLETRLSASNIKALREQPAAAPLRKTVVEFFHEQYEEKGEFPVREIPDKSWDDIDDPVEEWLPPPTGKYIGNIRK